MPQAQLTFWFDFASTYSYHSAIRIEALARSVAEVLGRARGG